MGNIRRHAARSFRASRARQHPDTANAAASASGTASQSPATPSTRGSSRIPAVRKQNVRRKDSSAEIFPSESAVKSAEVNRFTPQNRKETEKMRKPSTARR